jgi:Tfp pilus assembly protein PilV
MRSSGHRSRRLASEEGFALIEVLAAAALLVVIAVASLGVFDAAAKTSGRSKARSIAATLVEQDQERMRAMKATGLSNYHAIRTVAANGQAAPTGAQYTVDSRAEWVRDASGLESCTTSNSQADYLRITSTVTAPILSKSVTASSIVAPPVAAFGQNLGTLTVKVTNRDSNPVAGIDVAISGPTALSDTTNSLGCAVFSHVPIGTYSAATSRPGYVDQEGDAPGDVTAIVSAGKVTVAAAKFDLGAQATASFKTYVNPFSGYTGVTGWVDSKARSITAAGPVGARTVKQTSWQTSIDLPLLFPFTAGYGVYSGSCATADPTKYDGTFYTTYPDTFVKTDPGSTAPDRVARQPPVAARVSGLVTGSPVPAAKVVATATGAGCGADRFDDLISDPNGFVTHPGATFDPGLPFGPYKLCAYVPSTSPGMYLQSPAVTYANTAFTVPATGMATLLIPPDVYLNRTSNPCP